MITLTHADKTWSLTNKAIRHYEKGEYDTARDIFNEALLESPDNKKLDLNAGSAHYKLNEYDKAAQHYASALKSDNDRIAGDAHYNLGNTLFRRGEQLLHGGDHQKAMTSLKEAKEHYIKSLDKNSSDIDAKWNLQLTQEVLKQLEQQQKQNQDKDKKDDKQKQDKQNENQQSDKKNEQKNEQEKKQQENREQQREDQQQQQQQQQEQQQQQQSQDQPPPKPRSQNEEQVKEEQAERLIEQFADDADSLNKPPRLLMFQGKKPEKDW